MSIEITPAADEDIPALCRLLAILFTQEADFTPDATLQAAGLRMILANPATGLILCARQAGRVIGMVSLLFTVSTARGGRAAWLEDMIVDPAHRGAGTGALLLKEAIRQARDLDCVRITVLTDQFNAPAKRFYAKAGFTESAMVPLRLML
jgi:GNAT superfamily N-acetyltransferase